MGDAKDILGISRATSVSGHPPPPRAKGNSFVNKKPDGVSREVYALTGGVPPIVPAVDLAALKSKRLQASSPSVKWEWSPFTMGARTDNLKLHHWVKAAEAGALPAEYSFDKYNKAVDMVHYTGDEYSTLLHDPRWSQEETDHLFELCARFDLRFIVIADRFGVGGEWPERSVEDLKERYYSVVSKVVTARAQAGLAAPPDATFLKEAASVCVNIGYEVERKRALSLMLSQSRRQELEDQEVLAEARRIEEARRLAQAAATPPSKAAAGDGGGAAAASAPASAGGTRASEGPGAAAAAAAAGVSAAPPGPAPAAAAAGVGASAGAAAASGAPAAAAAAPVPGLSQERMHVRGQRVDKIMVRVTQDMGARMAKNIDRMLEEEGLPVRPRVKTRLVCAEHLALRQDAHRLLSLHKRIKLKSDELAMLKGSAQGEHAGPSKRGARGAGGAAEAERSAARAAAPGASSDPDHLPGVERQPGGRKGSGRGEPGSQHKRARKLKVPDD